MTDERRAVELDAGRYIATLEGKVAELTIEIARLSALLEALTVPEEPELEELEG